MWWRDFQPLHLCEALDPTTTTNTNTTTTMLFPSRPPSVPWPTLVRIDGEWSSTVVIVIVVVVVVVVTVESPTSILSFNLVETYDEGNNVWKCSIKEVDAFLSCEAECQVTEDQKGKDATWGRITKKTKSVSSVEKSVRNDKSKLEIDREKDSTLEYIRHQIIEPTLSPLTLSGVKIEYVMYHNPHECG
ncbi:hypothetical protein V1478_003125 [Vespula squamosa]|uniref:Uncharacterized protein n=1 Tax=Vespula squamosa TaxID=30214 RepID=A0ABD2BRT2_VESSQ